MSLPWRPVARISTITTRLRTDPLLAAACGIPDLLGGDRRHESDKGEPLAGKSTFNLLALGAAPRGGEYRKINADPAAIRDLLLVVRRRCEGDPAQVAGGGGGAGF